MGIDIVVGAQTIGPAAARTFLAAVGRQQKGYIYKR